MPVPGWKFTENSKRHTQDGPNLVQLMKSIGNGKHMVRAVDIGCGDGIIAFEMFKHCKATHVMALDIDAHAVDAAQKNLAAYIQAGKCEVVKKPAQRFFREKKYFDSFDRFVINPPFFPVGSGRANKSAKDQKARHESSLYLKLWTRGARNLLKTGGELYCVFPTERLTELCCELSKQNVEPKEIWWIKQDLRKRRFFLRAIRGARPGLIVHFEHSLKA